MLQTKMVIGFVVFKTKLIKKVKFLNYDACRTLQDDRRRHDAMGHLCTEVT